MPRRRGVSWAQVQRMAHQLPGVHDGSSYGTPALFVRKKLLIRLRDEGDSLAVRCDPVSRDLLLRTDAAMYFLTDHYRNYPWILVQLADADAGALRDRIEDAWRLVAGKRLIAEFEQ